ncbi:MAG: UDP-3-O-(3-hydroxymyristoyl)glucosamine N-acyltransferase, partial [Cucumibacter sp.]
LEGGIVIGPGAVIGPDCEIGTGTVIGANAVIGPGVAIGRHCAIGPGASLECTLAGDRVVIHAGARIGSEGFGFLPRPAGGRKIPQLGRVILQDGVEVGANSAIDRGTLADTVVGEGTKIDNLVQIAHNCRIGRHCQIAGASAFAGSASIGDHVLCGGHTKIVGLAHVGDHSIVYAEAGVTKSFPPHSRLAGFPARDVKQWRRDMAAVARLGRTTRDN